MEVKYLFKLKKFCDSLTDKYDKEIFASACRVYQEFFNGDRETKFITKKQILQNLCDKNLCEKRNGGLPDDRRLRERARDLLKRGYPIMSTSKENGYFIADSCGEIDRPQAENHKRAISILAIDKGYNKVRQMLGGQIKMGEENELE